jgi:predicted dehydrogenase
MSPFSRNYDIDLMETSFEEDVAEDHINAIWNASINYLKNSIKM